MGKVYLRYRFKQETGDSLLSGAVGNAVGTAGKRGGYIADRHDSSALGVDLQDSTSDQGVNIDNVLIVPPDKTPEDFSNIISAAGGTIIEAGDKAICSDKTEFTPRKLIFTRAGGGSFSVAVSTRDRLKTTALNVTDKFNDIVCIKLEGEEWNNLYFELAPANKDIKAGVSSRPDNKAEKYYVYSGSMQYEAGTGDGKSVTLFLPFKVDTDSQGDPPSILSESGFAKVVPGDSSAWGGCVQESGSSITCRPVGSRFKHKRYIADFLVNPAEGFIENLAESLANINDAYQQKTEVPVSKYKADDIYKCGQKIAAIPACICLAYRGESDPRFHRRIPSG